jgi:hypothetical protein
MRQTLLGMVLLSSSVIAFADPDHQHGIPARDSGPHQQAERASYSSRFEPRDAAVGPNEAEHRSGRLSPDERRELRRQINEAGHDIYQPRR